MAAFRAVALAVLASAVLATDPEVANNTNETEILFMPTAAPTMQGAVNVKTTTFTIKVTLQSVSDFDLAKFTTAMAASMGVNEADVELRDAKFEVKTSYTFAVAITAAEAKTAIAAGISELGLTDDAVTVSVTTSRRLSAGANQRRLATSVVESAIALPVAEGAKVATILVFANDAAAVATGLSAVKGSTVPAPTGVTTTLAVTATTWVKTTGSSYIQPPTAATFLTQLNSVLPGLTFVVESISAGVFADEVYTPPTSAPTPPPTVAPTIEDSDSHASPTSMYSLASALTTLAALLLFQF